MSNDIFRLVGRALESGKPGTNCNSHWFYLKPYYVFDNILKVASPILSGNIPF